MSINFPTNLDTLTNPTATDKVATVDHASQHANANDAIEALEAKVGKNSSGVTTSHDYKLSGVTGADKAVSITGSEVLTNKTLTSPTINTPVITTPVITTPKITTSINDVNGNEVIKTPATASAVNEVEITNAATGNDPLIAASGSDTDIGLKLKGKGTGKVKIGDAELQMPDVDGTDGQLLKTNGSAVLSWVSATSVPDADESTAGLVEEATDAETAAGTATGSTGAKLFVTPAKLATRLPTVLAPLLAPYQLINIFKNGATTYNVSTASGSQTIAHGLGNIPKKVRLTANLVGNAECITQAITVYNGTTQSSQYWSMQSGSGSSEEVGSTFKLYYTVGSGDYVTGVITFDATNITITWVKSGSPTGTANIMWEAQA